MQKLKSPLLILFGLLFIIPFFALAQDGTPSGTSLDETAGTLILIAKLLSWIWIPIANFTGKMMTNHLITGEAFNITSFLFQARSICRVIANFVIVGVVLQIIYNIALSGKGAGDIGGKIVRIVIASLCINASWFLLSALVDLSNVAVLGVSNLGYSLINSTPGIKKGMLEMTIDVPKEIIYDLNSKENPNKLPTYSTSTENANDIYKWVPTSEDMSGPLMYFGMGVFKIFYYLDIHSGSTFGPDGTLDNGSIVITFLLKLFLMLMFLTPLIALLVVSLVRMMLVWMRFALGPLIALRLGLGNKLADEIGWLKGIFEIGSFQPMISETFDAQEDHLNIGNIIGALFAPVAVTATLFLSLIVITSVFNGISNSGDANGTPGSAEFTTDAYKAFRDDAGTKINGKSITIQGGGSVDMNGDIITDVSNYIGGAFGYLIICLMTIGCMWAVFRVGLSTSKLLKHIGKTAMDKGKNALTTNIALPIGPGGSPVSLQAFHDKTFNLDKAGDYFSDNYINEAQRRNKRALERKAASQPRAQAMGYGEDKIKYQGSVPFKKPNNFDYAYESDPKQFADKGDVPLSSYVKDFEKDSELFFTSLANKMRDPEVGGRVTGDTYEFWNSIEKRLNDGGLSYLAYRKLIDKDKYFKDGKWNIEDIKKGEELGGLMMWIFKDKNVDKMTGQGSYFNKAVLNDQVIGPDKTIQKGKGKKWIDIDIPYTGAKPIIPTK